MTRRTRLMLVVVLGAVAALGAVRPGRSRRWSRRRGVPAAAGGGHDDRRAARSRGRRPIAAIGTVAAVQGVTRERRPAGRRRGDRLRVRPAPSARATCSSSSTRGRSRRSSRPPRRSASSRSCNLERVEGARASRASSPQAEFDRAERGAQAGRGAASARSAPRSSARRSARRSRASSASARSTSASTSTAGDPIVPLQSLDPIYVELLRAAAAGRPSCRSARDGAASRPTGAGIRARSRQGHGGRLGRRRGDAQRAGAGDARQPERQAAPGHVRRDGRRDSARSRAGRRAAGLGDQLRAVRRLGLRRRGHEGPEGRDRTSGVRQQFVKLGAGARRPGRRRSRASRPARRS